MAGALTIFIVSATAIAETIQGVAPGDQFKYSGNEGSFKCLTDGTVLPLSAVNDDFCDCMDGTDEPGTSACAGRRSTSFYCTNEQSTAAYLYASRVNDGICDCCDGSDEWLRAELACPNRCEEEGNVLRKVQGMREVERRRGLDKRRQLMESLFAERQNAQQALVLHRSALVDLEAAEALAAGALEIAKKDTLEDRRPKATNQSLESAAAPREEAPAVPPTEPVIHPASGEATLGASAGVGGAGVSEYAKWMEGAQSSLGDADADVVPVKPKPVASSNDKEEASSARRRRRSKNPLGLIWSQATEFVSNIKRKLMRSPAERAMDSAKGAHDKASKQMNEKRRQIQDVEKRLKELSVDDDQLAYASLAGRCVTKKFMEYKYEVCFFKSAKQDSTPLGNWLRWESPGVALFTNGRYCPKGPPRSLRVVFRCGTSEEIEEVSEPSRCAYEATIAHPAACSDEPLAVDARPPLPMEEL